MPPLRQHMLAALHLSGKGQRPQETSGREVRLLAQCYGKAPDWISDQALQASGLHRTNVDGLAPASMRICSSRSSVQGACRTAPQRAGSIQRAGGVHPLRKVAIATSRIGSRKDRTGTVPYRTLGSARPRTTHRDARELLRRCLQHGWPDGFLKVRYCDVLPASCVIPTDAIRRMIAQAHPLGCQPTRRVPPAPGGAFCPTGGGPMRVGRRRWTSHRAVLDTG